MNEQLFKNMQKQVQRASLAHVPKKYKQLEFFYQDHIRSICDVGPCLYDRLIFTIMLYILKKYLELEIQRGVEETKNVRITIENVE